VAADAENAIELAKVATKTGTHNFFKEDMIFTCLMIERCFLSGYIEYCDALYACSPPGELPAVFVNSKILLGRFRCSICYLLLQLMGQVFVVLNRVIKTMS
jgi:hypothetical protein